MSELDPATLRFIEEQINAAKQVRQQQHVPRGDRGGRGGRDQGGQPRQPHQGGRGGRGGQPRQQHGQHVPRDDRGQGGRDGRGGHDDQSHEHVPRGRGGRGGHGDQSHEHVPRGRGGRGGHGDQSHEHVPRGRGGHHHQHPQQGYVLQVPRHNIREACLEVASRIEAFQRGHREVPDKPPKTEAPVIPHMDYLPPDVQKMISHLLPQLKGEKREQFIQEMTLEAEKRYNQVVSRELHAIGHALNPPKPPSLFDRIKKAFE